MWDIQTIIPSIALNESLAVRTEHIKFWLERSIAQPWSHKTNSFIIHIFPILRPLPESFIYLSAVKLFGKLRNAPIIVSIFKCLRYGGAIFIIGHIAEVHVMVQTVIIFLVGCGYARIQRLIKISFQCSIDGRIGYYRNAVVADHTPVLVGIVR